MKEFIKRNKVNLLVIFLIGFATYFIRICFYTISIDTESYINTPGEILNSWLGIGRFGLVLLKNILGFIPMNLTVTNIVAFIIFYLSIVVWLVNIEKWQKKENKIANLVFGLTLISSPILAEQFGFTLQNIEISLAFLTVAIGIFFQQKWMRSNKVSYAILTIPFITLSFSCYQAFIVLYITICAFEYIMQYNRKMDYKKIEKYLLIFIVSVALYYGINILIKKIFSIETAGYLTEQIYWGQKSLSSVLFRIIASIGITILGIGIEQNLAFTLIFIVMTIYLLKNVKLKQNKMFYCIYLFLFTTPFLTTILKGNIEMYRAKFSLAFLIAFAIYYLLNKVETPKMKKAVKYIAIYTIVVQAITTTFLFYNDYKRYQEDVELSYIINEKIQTMDMTKPVIFVGQYKGKNTQIKGLSLGSSFFSWDAKTALGVNKRAHGFLKTLNIEYQFPSLEQIEQARKEAIDIPIWNKEGSIVEKDEYIIVNFGEIVDEFNLYGLKLKIN